MSPAQQPTPDEGGAKGKRSTRQEQIDYLAMLVVKQSQRAERAEAALERVAAEAQKLAAIVELARTWKAADQESRAYPVRGHEGQAARFYRRITWPWETRKALFAALDALDAAAERLGKP